jgi:hypothetical protein
MTNRGPAKHYDRLTPEERFQLILAAGGRGDALEQGRVRRAGSRRQFAMQDHAPFALAFGEVSRNFYLELLEQAHRFADAINAAGSREGTAAGAPSAADVDEAERRVWAASQALRALAGGWKLFCERLHVPPLALWRHLPGYTRLEAVLRLAELSCEPEGAPHRKEQAAGLPDACPASIETIAEEAEEAFRDRVFWWSG